MTPNKRSPRVVERNGKMDRVSAARPCPVCEKTDWCLLAADGSACICARVEQGAVKKCGDAGYLHRLIEPVAATRPSKKKSPPQPNDWPVVATKLAIRFTPAHRLDLAHRLRLPPEAFDALPLIGVASETTEGTTITFPESDAAGLVIGINRRFPDDTKKAMRGGRRGLTLPVGWADRFGPVFVVEGPTDTLAMTAAELACVGRPSNRGGAELLAELLAEWPTDRAVIIVGERDAKPNGNWPGRDGAVSIARELARRLRRPIKWALPPIDSKDVRDWLTNPDRDESSWPARSGELAATLLATAEVNDPTDGAAPDTPNGGTPEIVVGTDEHRVNAEAAVALANEPDVYQRGGLLVHVREQVADPDPNTVVRRPVGAPVVRQLPRSLLREHLTRCASWKQWKGTGDNTQLVPAHPPDWCVGAVYDRGQWPCVRPLTAVVPHPVILPDGSILTASGYHSATGLLACIPPGLTVSVTDAPSRNAIAAAVSELLDTVCDFPFETPAHRSAWIAGLLTPLAWYLFDGPAPLFLTDANIRAAGKGLIVDVIALIVTGRRFPVMSYTPRPGGVAKADHDTCH